MSSLVVLAGLLKGTKLPRAGNDRIGGFIFCAWPWGHHFETEDQGWPAAWSGRVWRASPILPPSPCAEYIFIYNFISLRSHTLSLM